MSYGKPIQTQCIQASAFCLLSILCSLTYTAEGFQIPFPQFQSKQLAFQDKSSSLLILQSTKKNTIVDVEFERTPDPEEEEETLPKQKSKRKRGKKNSKGTSLLDLSLESLEDSDPRWKDARVPFIDVERETAIDCKVAFVVELEGVQYGIAVPCDASAAITVEDKDGSVMNIYPDDDENEELMEIMASQLVEHVGEDLALKRTPRVLTIEGDLDAITDNWQDEILPTPTPVKELLQDDGEDMDWAFDFFRNALGEEEYQKTINEGTTAEDLGDDFMALFDVPGMGGNGVEGLEEMIRSLNNEEDPMKAALEKMGGDPTDREALKLLSYSFKDGKAYSLVRLLKPYTLVGRMSEESEGLQFELLSKEEEELVIPKLEEVCRKDLDDAGLKFSP